MKKLCIGLCAAWLAVPGMLQAGLLKNGSFEQPGDSGDRAAHWGWWGDWFNRETDWRPTRNGKCLAGYHHWQIETDKDSGLYQDVEGLEPGKPYSFSVWACADAVEEGKQPAKEVELRMEVPLYEGQTTVASRRFKVAHLAESGRWSRLRLTTTAPSDRMRVLLVVYPAEGDSPRGGAVKFDQAVLEPLD
jgi:hypothetical protein